MNLYFASALISATVAGSVGFGAAWHWQDNKILALKVEAKDAIIKQQRAARATSERLARQVITAQNAAAARNVALRRDADSAAFSGNGLRIASTNAVRASSADIDACAASLTAHSVVLGSVVEFATRVSEEADQWASHAVALQEGWPK